MDKKILERFFNKKCSLDEQRKVLAWYLSGEADLDISERIENIWKEEERNIVSQWNKDGVFQSIDQKISSSEQLLKTNKKSKRASSRLLWMHWRNVAAIFLILSCIGGVTYYFFYAFPFLTSENTKVTTETREKILVKETAKGEKLTITLKDNTVVKLNSESQLKYSRASEREVYLEGEAFFEVTPDSLHPFLIHTGNITTTVLGTSFNIKAFANEDDIAISVVTGKVKVEKSKLESQDQIIHLTPGEQAVYRINDTLFTKQLFDYQDVLSWKEGRLYFKNARFSEVVSTLERWYGVEIELKRKDIDNGFSGSYSNRSLESILEGMSFVLDFTYEIKDNKIIIK